MQWPSPPSHRSGFYPEGTGEPCRVGDKGVLCPNPSVCAARARLLRAECGSHRRVDLGQGGAEEAEESRKAGPLSNWVLGPVGVRERPGRKHDSYTNTNQTPM